MSSEDADWVLVGDEDWAVEPAAGQKSEVGVGGDLRARLAEKLEAVQALCRRDAELRGENVAVAVFALVHAHGAALRGYFLERRSVWSPLVSKLHRALSRRTVHNDEAIFALRTLVALLRSAGAASTEVADFFDSSDAMGVLFTTLRNMGKTFTTEQQQVASEAFSLVVEAGPDKAGKLLTCRDSGFGTDITNNNKTRSTSKRKKKKSKSKNKKKAIKHSGSAKTHVALLETVLERAPCESGRGVSEMMRGRLNWKAPNMVIVENYVEQTEENKSV